MKTKLIIIQLLLVFIISSCSKNEVKKESIIHVKTDTITAYESGKSMVFPGRIKAGDDINLSFRIAGPIASINVSSGNFVKKGEVLAQIDPRDYRTQLSATEAKYNQIKNEVERIEILYKKDGITDNEYDKAIYGLKQIKAKYDAHKSALNDTKLIAPFDGYIQKTHYATQETVDAGMPVVSMIGTSSMEVEINIPSRVYAKKDEIDKYICTTDMYPNKEYPLEVKGINRKANLNELYTVYLNLKTPDGFPKLTPGMNVKVEAKFKNNSQDHYLVPINALISGKTGDSVWVYDEQSGTIHKRDIKTDGINNKGYSIVLSGLKKGEIVISAGASSLEEGQKVQPLKKQSKTNTGDIL